MLGVGKQKYTTNEPSYSWVVQKGKDENDKISSWSKNRKNCRKALHSRAVENRRINRETL